MVLYDCLNFELVNIKTKKINLLREIFLCDFCIYVSFSFGNMKTYFVSVLRFSLKLCAIWIHVSLKVVKDWKVLQLMYLLLF
jgi:hypothetical protein